MNTGTALLYVGVLLLIVVMFSLAYMGLRTVILVGRGASFGAWIINPESNKWVRGIALYGQLNLAWYRLSSASTSPTILLPRTNLEVVGGPTPSRDANYTVVRLRAPQETYTLALLPGDAAGLISWVNSAPPGIVDR